MAELTRREAMGMVGAAAVGAAVGRAVPAHAATGTLNQSVCRWCFSKIPLPTFFEQVRATGLSAVDLLDEEEWSVARQYGLACSTGYGGGGTITEGLNDPANHNTIIHNLERSLPAAARAGVPNVIAFFGNRRGMTDAEGIDHCVSVLRRVAPVAESEGVTVVLELLNSRVDHPDYHGDRMRFGSEVVERVASPRVKLLYDIYHMQVMEGNVIRTIRDHHQQIGHYHTAGVPGRHELGPQQELHWPAIARAIADTGFQGYVAHEFIPTRDPMTSLREAVASCNV